MYTDEEINKLANDPYYIMQVECQTEGCKNAKVFIGRGQLSCICSDCYWKKVDSLKALQEIQALSP